MTEDEGIVATDEIFHSTSRVFSCQFVIFGTPDHRCDLGHGKVVQGGNHTTTPKNGEEVVDDVEDFQTGAPRNRLGVSILVAQGREFPKVSFRGCPKRWEAKFRDQLKLRSRSNVGFYWSSRILRVVQNHTAAHSRADESA